MEETYVKRLFPGTAENYFLFGPRGTGKTSWIKSNLTDYLLIDLLDPELYRQLNAKPERLRHEIKAKPELNPVVIDEVQKVPELLAVVHALIEEDKSKQFILTGSSARKIKQSGVDLLGGRALKLTMHPFMAVELGSYFDLEAALNTGLLPIHYFKANSIKSKALSAYIDLYIKEEVQMEGAVRNIGNFNRFLEAISFSHGSILNISNVARECQVERKTVEGYFRILFDLLLVHTIPVFNKRAKRIIVNHPKFYFFDAGVFRTIRPRGPLDNTHEIDGPALEGLIAQHLKAWIDYGDYKVALYYWRTKSGTEVDFVLYGESGFWAIEVKNTDVIRNSDLKPLKTFHSDYPSAMPVYVYRGNRRLLVDNILCIPCHEFLINLTPGQPLV